MAFPGTKHGTRRRPYKVFWGVCGSTTVNAKEWRNAVASGWIVPEVLEKERRSDRLARVAFGVRARLRNGVLRLSNSSNQDYWIYTSWIGIDRQAPMIRGEFYRKEVRRQYAPVAPLPDADVFERWGQFEGPGGVPATM